MMQSLQDRHLDLRCHVMQRCANEVYSETAQLMWVAVVPHYSAFTEDQTCNFQLLSQYINPNFKALQHQMSYYHSTHIKIICFHLSS